MGRAIAMEKQLGEFKERIKIVEDALSTVIDVVESMQEKGQRTTHVDLVDDVKSEEVVKDDWDPNEIGIAATKMMEEGAEKYAKEKSKSKKSNEKAKRLKKD